MKTKKVVLSIFVFTLMLLSYHCSDIDGNYDNPSDPESGKYVPNSPTYLQLSVSSDTLISLAWRDVSIGEKGFLIERKIGINGIFSLLAKVPSDVVNYEDHIIMQKGTTYYYRVSAYTDNAKSYYTSEDSISFSLAVPAKPVVTVQSNNSCQINWNNYDLIPKGYILEKSINGTQFFKVATIDKGTTFFIDNDIDTLNSYSYRVKSFTNNNESDYSNATQIEYGITDITLLKTVNLGSPVHSIAFNADGSMFAAAGMSYALRIWKTNDFSLVRNLSYSGSDIISEGWPFQVAFSPDGNLIAGDAGNMGVNIWNIQTGNIVRKLSLPGEARAICFTNDSQSIITGDFSGIINCWSIQNGALTGKVNTPSSSEIISFLYITKVGNRLISGNYGFPGPTNEGVQIWNTANWSEITSFIGFQAENYSVSKDEKYLIAGNNLRSLGNGSLISSFPGSIDGGTCLTYDSKYFIGKYYSGAIVVGRVSDGKILFSRSITSPNIYSYPALVSSPASYTFVAAGNTSGAIDIWTFVRKWSSY